MRRPFLAILFTFFAATVLLAQPPSISDIEDAGSYTPGIVPGGVFVVKGLNLCASSYQGNPQRYDTNLLGSVQVAFTSSDGSTTASAYMVYAYNSDGRTQLAGILPSTVSPGNYTARVTSAGLVSMPFAVTVVPRKFTIVSLDGSGSGEAALQIQTPAGAYSYDRFTTGNLPINPPNGYSPAHPGDYIVAYGTGLGPIQGPDNTPPGAIDFRNQLNIQVLVGGMSIAPLYAGRSPNYPGADQVNFQLPSNVPTGCAVSFQVSVNGQLSNPTTISIAPAGASACVSPLFNQDFLTRLDQGGSLVIGNFALSQISMPATVTLPQPYGTVSGTATVAAAGGAFTKFPGPQLSNALALLNPGNSCQVFRRTGSQSQLLVGLTSNNLDAGPITLILPDHSTKSFSEDASKNYSLALGAALTGLPSGAAAPPPYLPSPVITTGTYQLSGAGGSDVGKFSASVTVGQPIIVTGGLPATVNRSQNLTISWSGGTPSDLVQIVGFSGTVIPNSSTSPVYDAGMFICNTTAGASSFTVPSSVLSQLPASPASNGLGYLLVSTSTQSGTFTAPLAAGGNIDEGLFLATFGTSSNVNFQ